MDNNGKVNTRAITAVALTVALISVCAMISIPIAIPITLQSFGIYFALFFLGGKLGSLSVFIYLSLGALGVPIFAGFTGGIARFFDASGGFLFGFLLAALLFWLLEYLLPVGARFSIASAALSLVLLYICGVLWYFFIYLGGGDFLSVILGAVLPFIIPDIIKIFFAYLLCERLKTVVNINIQRKN